MKTVEAIRTMLDSAGTSAYRVALDMGKTDSYVSGMLRRGNEPSPSVLSDIAAECGYGLALVPDDSPLPDGSIPIDGRG